MEIDEARLEQHRANMFYVDVDKDDLVLEWEEFHLKYPDVPQECYDLLVKEFQEM